MARTSITTARYNPFTMEELYSPVLRATEQHLQQQEKYDELANQMNIWKYRLPQNSEARTLYDNYEKMFNAAVDDLNANGINNPSARDNARALIKENPIPAFIETQKQYDDFNKQKQSLGPNTLFVKEPTFDDFFYGRANTDYIDLDKVNAKAQNDIALVARTLTQEPAFKKATGAGGQYFNVASTTGITDAMWQMAKDKKNGASFGADLDAQLDRLNNTVDNIYTYAKYDQFANQDDKQKAIDAAIQNGLQAGSAITSYKEAQDHSYSSPLAWATYKTNAAGQDAQMYLHGMVPDGKGGYTYDPVVAAKVAGSSGNGTKTPKGPQDPYSVHSIDFDENGKMVLNSGNYGYTTTDSNGKSTIHTYKNMEDFASKRSKENLVIPNEGWSFQDLNKTLVTQTKGKDTGSVSVKNAILGAYKDRFGIDYKTYYEALPEASKNAFGNADAFGVWYIQHEILPYYDIAFGRNTDNSRKPTTNWEVFMKEKSLGNTLSPFGENTSPYAPESEPTPTAATDKSSGLTGSYTPNWKQPQADIEEVETAEQEF